MFGRPRLLLPELPPVPSVIVEIPLSRIRTILMPAYTAPGPEGLVITKRAVSYGAASSIYPFVKV